jgi:tRNA(Ile)-lysidine synthase
MLTSKLLTKVRKTIRKHGMLRKGDHVLVGLSGGADSVALLAALIHLRPACGIALTAAHFNHKTRASESDRDEAFVRTLCKSVGVALICGSLKDAKRPRGISLEDYLRRNRYEFLEKARQKAAATRIALGHHQGDQAETVLMNVIRGAGLNGLSGIPPVRNAGTLIRPLIDCSRREIVEYLAAAGLSFVDDSSNADERFLRNRIRSSLMPELEKRYNPAVGETLCRLAEVIRTENDYMKEQAQILLSRWRKGRGQDKPLEIPIAELMGLHPALQRRAILEIARDSSAADAAIGLEHVEAVLDMAGGVNPGGSLDLPGGLRVGRTYGRLEFRRVSRSDWRSRRGTAPDESKKPFQFEVTIPGTVRIPGGTMSIRFRELKRAPSVLSTERKAYLDMERIAFPLVVRSVLPGDRIQPLGMKGTRKLKSVFIDEKIPREHRGRIPVVADGISVLWVPGVRLSERVRVGKGSKRILSAEIV